MFWRGNPSQPSQLLRLIVPTLYMAFHLDPSTDTCNCCHLVVVRFYAIFTHHTCPVYVCNYRGVWGDVKRSSSPLARKHVCDPKELLLTVNLVGLHTDICLKYCNTNQILHEVLMTQIVKEAEYFSNVGDRTDCSIRDEDPPGQQSVSPVR